MSVTGVIIPCFMGSRRFPGKPLANVGGKPLLSYAVEAARESGLPWYVAYCDEEIEYWADTQDSTYPEIIETPKTCRNGTERAAFANQELKWDRVVVLQCDEPDVTGEDLKLLVNSPTPCTLACLPSDHDVGNVNSVGVGITSGWIESVCLFFRRGVTLGNTMRHIGVYVYDAKLLAEYLQHPMTPAEESQSLEQLRTMAIGYAWHLRGFHDRSLRSVNVPADVEAFE